MVPELSIGKEDALYLVQVWACEQLVSTHSTTPTHEVIKVVQNDGHRLEHLHGRQLWDLYGCLKGVAVLSCQFLDFLSHLGRQWGFGIRYVKQVLQGNDNFG